MDQLFGVPTRLLATIAVTALGSVLLALAVLLWRRPLLVRLGLRNAPRRPLRSILIVLGLTTSTAVIATAIGTGETMAGTIRAAVAGGIGPADQVIVANGAAPSNPSLRDPKAVLAGADLAAGTFFPIERYDDLNARIAEYNPGVSAFEPAIQTEATAIADGRSRTGVTVIGLRPGAPVFDTFMAGGQQVHVADLQPGYLMLNVAAATLLEARLDSSLLLRFPGDREAARQVYAIVEDGGIAGVQPAIFLPLPVLQGMLNRANEVNQILVANRAQSAKVSRDVTAHFRLELADDFVLQRAARALATDAGQSQLKALEGRVRPELRPYIDQLRRISRSGEVTPELAYYLADPLLTNQYRWVINAAIGDRNLRGQGLSEAIAPLSVVEVKQRAITAANEYGSAVTTVFLILGLFSIAASLLLVFLIFVMLAAERRTEMGLARAIGAQRHHLITAFAVEGLAYDLLASVVGLIMGVGVGALVLRLASTVLDRFDVAVRGHMSAGGMVLSFALGALVTFITVLLAAWRVSHVNVIAAIHGLPPPEVKRSRAPGVRAALRAYLRLLAGPVLVLLLIAAGAVLVSLPRGPLRSLSLLGVTLIVVAGALVFRWVLTRLGLRRHLVDRLVAVLAGPIIAVLFALPPDAPRLIRADGDGMVRSATAGFVLAGVAMALALVWVAGRNLDLILLPVRLLARPFGSLAPAIRMAVAYPLTHPFRTGLTAAMFALVFLTMVAAMTLLRSTEEAYVRRDGNAGFDIRALFATPPEDFPAQLSASTAVRPDDFTAVGSQSVNNVESLWPGENRAVWRPIEVRVADDALLATSTAELIARAEGIPSDEAAWRALLEQPGAALVSRHDLEGFPELQRAVVAGNEDQLVFKPAPVWVRDPRGGPARKLLVIGVTGEGSILPGGLLTSRAGFAGTPAEAAPPTEYYLRAREDVSFRGAAAGVQLTFPDNGVRVRVLGDEARTGHAVRNLLDQLIRGFLGMGLAAGIAALGVIGMRSVAERRQQIGMLRAIGFSRRSIQTAFLIEGSVVAILGITVGGVVGLVLARNVVVFLHRDLRQLELLIPWAQVLLIGAAAYAAALTSALVVAWQAGRISPAEALRYE